MFTIVIVVSYNDSIGGIALRPFVSRVFSGTLFCSYRCLTGTTFWMCDTTVSMWDSRFPVTQFTTEFVRFRTRTQSATKDKCLCLLDLMADQK